MLLCVAMVFGVLVEYAVVLRFKDRASKFQVEGDIMISPVST